MKNQNAFQLLCHLLVRSVAALVCCISLGVPHLGMQQVAAQEKKSNAENVKELELQQKQLATRFGKLEELFIRMSELEATTNPTRAGLLMQAAKMSKQLATLQRLSVAGDLLSQGQFTRAIQEQESSQENLKKLLELLQSENRSSRLKDERTRLQEIQQEIRRLEQIQRGQTARTESGQDLKQSAADQKDIKEQLEKVASDLKSDKDGSEDKDKADNKDPSQGDKPKDDKPKGDKSDGDDKKDGGESKSDQNKKDDAAKEGLNKDGEKKDSSPDSQDPNKKDPSESKDPSKENSQPKGDQPKSGKPQDQQGEPKDGKSQDSQKPPKKQDGQSKDSDSKDSDSKDSESPDSQSKDSESKDSQKSGESPKKKGPQKPESKEEKAKKRVEAARKKMQNAQDKLEEKNREEAVEEQREAERELREAIEELERILRQLREEEIERSLVDVETRLRKMLDLQRAVREQTEKLGNLTGDAKDLTLEIQANKLAIEQTKIVMEGQRALLLLQDEGSSTAFPEALQQVNADAQSVSKKLSEGNVSSLTLAIEDEIIGALDEMLESLKQVQKKREDKKKQQQEQQQQQQGNPEDEPLVDSIAELKLLKTLQLRINRRTQSLAKQTDNQEDVVGQVGDPGLRGELADLAERQQKIHEVTREILLKAVKD